MPEPVATPNAPANAAMPSTTVDVPKIPVPGNIANELARALMGNGNGAKPEEKPAEPAAPAAPAVEQPKPEEKGAPAEAPKEEPVPVKADEPAASKQNEPATPDEFGWIHKPEEPKSYDEDTIKVMEKLFGTKDVAALMETHRTNAERAQKHDQVQAQLARIEQEVLDLPAPLQMAVKAALQKDHNWSAHLKDVPGGLDLSKAADKQDKWALVDHYYKGKFTAEERQAFADGVAEEPLKDKLENYVGLAAEKFDHYRTTKEGEMRERDAAMLERQRLYMEHIDRAITHASQQYPNIRAIVDTPKFREGMATGEIFSSPFIDKNGLPKPNAAVAALIAANPEGFIASVERNALRKAREQAQLEQMDRTTAAPRTPAGGGSQPTADPNRPTDPTLMGYYDYFKQGLPAKQ